MQESTLDIVKTALKADPSVSPDDRKRMLTFMVKGPAPPPKPLPVDTAPMPPRILTRRAVAERFGRSIRFVDVLAKEGKLHKVRLPGRKYAAGFREADVVAFMQGLEGLGASPEA